MSAVDAAAQAVLDAEVVAPPLEGVPLWNKHARRQPIPRM